MISPRLEDLFHRLWTDFTSINPQAEAIHQMLTVRGETIVNDHIAFRTFDDPRVNLDVIARPFLEEGYSARDEYQFKEKKLFARHYEHNDPRTPKVFISELLTGQFDSDLQRDVRGLVDQIPDSVLEDPLLCVSGRPWNLEYPLYESLLKKSEYAGWMSAFGFRANHFTILVNALRTVDSLSALNSLMREAGFALNTQGGEIKGSPADYLEQSSTLASQLDVAFADGTHRIPGCYYEFALRYPLPDGTLFQGFVARSADKIFESTDRNAR